MRRTAVAEGELTVKHRRRRQSRLSALMFGLALAWTGGAQTTVAAGGPLGGAPPSALAPGGASAENLLDCAVEDMEMDPRHGFDDRCEMWAVIYDDPELYDNSFPPDPGEPTAVDRVQQLVASPTGERVFTFGRSCNNPPECRWAVVAHRADTGDELWRVHEDQVDRPVGLMEIAVSSSGDRVYATGQLGGSGRPVHTRPGDGDPLFHADVLTMAWDAATGRKLWERRYDGGPIGHREGEPHDLHSENSGRALAVDPVGDGIYVTGYSDDRDGFYDLLVIAYDGATGVRRWVATHDTSTSENPYVIDEALPRLAQVSTDGASLYLVARTGSDVRLLAYQAHDPQVQGDDGTLRWVGDSLAGIPETLNLAPDGSRIYLQGSQPRIAAYDSSTGQEVWNTPFSSEDGASGIPSSLAVSPDGDLVVATGSLGETYGMVAYDAGTGDRAWSTTSELSQARAVAVSPDGGRVYATGVSTGRPEEGIGRQGTVAYDASSGETLWVAVYSRPLYAETGSLLDVGPDGTVFTAGRLRAQAGYDSLTKNIEDWGVQGYEP